MDVALQLALRGVALPFVVGAALFGLSAWLTRGQDAPRRALMTGLAAAIGVTLGFGLAAQALGVFPPWPAVESTHWLVWMTLGAGVLSLAIPIGLSTLPAPWRHGVGIAVAAGLAFVIPGKILVNLIEHAWKPEEASRHIWLARAALFGAWLLLDLAVSRLSERGGAALLAAFAGASAAVVVLGKTAMIAQLLGALAAATGGVALVTLLPGRTGLSVRAAALPVAVAVVASAMTARHVAYLAEPAMLLIAAAPAAALVLTFGAWRERLHLAVTQGGPVVAMLLVLGATVPVAEQPEPEYTGSGEVELEYGYDSIDLDSKAPDVSGDGATPDYSNLQDWKPEPAAP